MPSKAIGIHVYSKAPRVLIRLPPDVAKGRGEVAVVMSDLLRPVDEGIVAVDSRQDRPRVELTEPSLLRLFSLVAAKPVLEGNAPKLHKTKLQHEALEGEVVGGTPAATNASHREDF